MGIWGIGTDLEVKAPDGSIKAGWDEHLSSYIKTTDRLDVIETV